MVVKRTLKSRTNTGGLSGRKLRLAVTFISVMGFSLFGYDQGLMSGIITGTKFNEEFPPTAGSSHHATVIQGAVTSCYELGCFFGAIFALLRGENFGRRPLIIAGSFIIIIGTVISVSAFGPHWGLGQFVVGRVITGVGNGLNTATIPVWQSEMSKAKNRGFLVNLEGAVVAFGTLVAYWLDFGLSYVNSSVQWRFPVAFQIFFAAIVFFGVQQLPESPRWLIAQKRNEEGIQVLAALEGTDVADENIKIEARVVMEAISRTGHNQGGLRDVFTSGKTQHLRRMLIGCSTQFFQQFTGCNAAIYYSTVLFQKSLNQSRRMSLVMGGIFATVYALSTIPSFFMIERVGRRNLFLIGAIGQGCAFLITMGCLIKDSAASAKGAAVGLYLFIFFFAFTILPLPWVYPPEINPNKTRTIAASFSTCTNWICNFAVVMFTPIFIGQSQWGCYLFFAAMNFAWVPIIFFFYPETAGRRLEEMDIIFAKAYNEKKFSWRVAQTMPFLTDAQIEQEAEIVGLYDIYDNEKPEKAEQVEDISSQTSSSGPEV